MTRYAVSRPALIPTMLTACLFVSTIGSAEDPASKEPATETPATKPAPAAEQLTRIVESMRGIEARLKDRETGDETQSQQQSVIDQLDKLLNMPPDSPPPSGSGGGGSNNNPPPDPKNGGGKSRNQPSPQSQQNKSKPSGDPNQMRPKPAGQPGGKGRKNADDSEERIGPNRAATTPAAKRERLKVDVWGHLPEKLREQLLSSYGEKMLPQYEDAVRRFYDQLADPPQPRRPR